MDILTRLYENLLISTESLDPTIWDFLRQATLLFACATMCVVIAFAYGSRSVTIARICAVTGALLSFSIPTRLFDVYRPALKAWFLMIFIILLVSLPRLLALWLTPKYGTQVKLSVLFYAALIILFLVNLR